jgi:hypothetical protein
MLPHFFARYAEPRAEAEDAFAVGDWDRSRCPFCGLCQREVLYAFPPTALFNRFVAKARADGASAILVTPLAVSGLSAPYWPQLLRASVVTNADGFLRVQRQQSAPPDSDVPGKLAFFAVDFSPWSNRRRPDAPLLPCGCVRGRDPCVSPTDQADRQRIRAQMVQLGLALR